MLAASRKLNDYACLLSLPDFISEIPVLGFKQLSLEIEPMSASDPLGTVCPFLETASFIPGIWCLDHRHLLSLSLARIR